MTIATLVLAHALATGCGAAGAGGDSVALEEPFGLRVGETVAVDATPLEIGLVEVSSDSRCPKGEQCVWAGDATVRIRVSGGSETEQILELHTARDREQTGSGDGFGVRLLRLDPQPVTRQTIAPADYCALLEVRPGAGSAGELQ